MCNPISIICSPQSLNLEPAEETLQQIHLEVGASVPWRLLSRGFRVYEVLLGKSSQL